jgi:uncharacterized protein with FMN-binding domain
MKRRTMAQVVPALIMTGAAAVPIVTTVEILSHVPAGGRAVGLQPSAPVAAAPARPSSRSSATSAPPSSGGNRTVQGPVVNDPFGGVQATLTLSGQKISNVSISAPMDNPRSAGINQQAVPYLASETLQAQSAQINTISGATWTSQAYIQSLQAALTRAHAGTSSGAGNPASSPASAAGSQTPSVSVPGDD